MKRQATSRWAVLTLLGLLTSGALSATQAPTSWPPISQEELSLKDSPANPGAPAIILYREVSTDDMKRTEAQFMRVKIFTEAGKKYADIELPYDEREFQIDDIHARTLRPDGSAIEFQGQVVDRVIVKSKRLRFQVKTFTLPGVQTGSIIEYSYRAKWHTKLPDYIKEPEKYVFRSVSFYPSVVWTLQRELFTKRAHFSFRTYPKANLRYGWIGLPKNVSPKLVGDRRVELDVENVMALEAEESMPPEGMLSSRVHFYYLAGSVGSPYYFWSEYSKSLGEELEKFIGNPKKLQPVVRQLISPDDPPDVKLRKIYARVQQIRYVSYEPARTQKEEHRENRRENHSAKDVLDHGYASFNEINFLFVALARAAGFDAWIVEISARDKNVFSSQLLDPRQLNGMVVLVRSNSSDVYLDPATRFCPYGLLPWAEAESQGIRADRVGSTGTVTTPSQNSDSAIAERRAKLQLLDDGTLQGELQLAFKGQEALQRRLRAYDEDDAGKRKQMEDEIKEWLPSGSTVELTSAGIWDSSEEPLRVECRVRIPSFAVRTGHRVLLPVGLFHEHRFAFQSETRRYPLFFPYAFKWVDHVSVELKKGFRVESMPSSHERTLSSIGIRTAVTQDADRLELRKTFNLETTYIPASYYASLRVFVEEVRSYDEEKVVLRAPDTGQSR
jgi:hypothetical protein